MDVNIIKMLVWVVTNAYIRKKALPQRCKVKVRISEEQEGDFGAVEGGAEAGSGGRKSIMVFT